MRRQCLIVRSKNQQTLISDADYKSVVAYKLLRLACCHLFSLKPDKVITRPCLRTISNNQRTTLALINNQLLNSQSQAEYSIKVVNSISLLHRLYNESQLQRDSTILVFKIVLSWLMLPFFTSADYESQKRRCKQADILFQLLESPKIKTLLN